MKQKIFFMVQVFTVLALFLSIFVTSLVREKNRGAAQQEAAVLTENNDEDGGSSSSLFVPFTSLLQGLLDY